MKWVLIAVGGLVALVALMALGGALLPREHRATSTIQLRQPPESVWAVIRDFGGVPAWWSEVKSSERLPDKDGREAWHQQLSGFDVPLVVIEATPPARLVTEIDTGAGAAFGGTWTYELSAEGDSGGTRLSVTEAGWIANPIFRFLSRFVFGYYGSLDGYLQALGKRFGEEVTPRHS